MTAHRMRRLLWLLPLAVVLIVAAALLYRFNIIPHSRYTNADFGISPYVSQVDADGDGIDDQTDILQGSRDYVATKPSYESRYYDSGYPDDGYGVCTDVVAFALRSAGYDLMELVSQDIQAHPEDYDIDTPDPAIDFRRVRNLEVYFRHTAISLTTDPEEIDQWQGGDIVIFPHHIGVVSDVRNRQGLCFVIHHASPGQRHYEEDILTSREAIIGHYRVS